MTAPTDLTLDGVSLLDAVPSANVVRVMRPLVGRRRHVSIDVPGRAGAWTFPEEPGDRVLSADIVIVADTIESRRSSVRSLAAWADPGTAKRLIISDEPDRFHEALLDDSANPDEWLTAAGALSLPFRAGPYALALDLSTELLNIGAFPASGSLSIPDEVNALPILEITPTNGTLTSFSFTINGYTLAWSGFLANGSTLTISSLSDTVTVGPNGDVNLTGAFNPAELTMADVSGEFPILFPGSNPWGMTHTGTATTATVQLTWRERFR